MGGCVVSVQRFGFRCCGATFIRVLTIRTSNVYIIIDKK